MTQKIHQNRFANEQVLMDPDAFDQFIGSHGVAMEHWRSMKDPYGLTDRDGNRKPNQGDSYSSNGFIYTKAGNFDVLFGNNVATMDLSDPGLMDGSTVAVTTPRFYEDGSQVYVLIRDLFYLADPSILVPQWELVEHNVSGIDSARFLVEKVQDIVSSEGKRFYDTDYALVNGKIEWGRNRPVLNPDTGKGETFAIRYLYRPYWYVSEVRHEIRLQQVNGVDGPNVQRFPQQFVLQREFVFENKTNVSDVTGEDDARHIMLPRDGGFGPR